MYIKLRSYCTKDYIEVPKLKETQQHDVSADRDCNATRVADETQVGHEGSTIADMSMQDFTRPVAAGRVKYE